MNASVRLPLMPAPILDETFGSWFRRCAEAYHTTTFALSASIFRMVGRGSIPTQMDWDTDPSVDLVNALAGTTCFRQSELEYLIVRSGPATLPIDYRDTYCPQCFETDVERKIIYFRRSWLDAWAIACPTHGCLLGRFSRYEYKESARSVTSFPRGVFASDDPWRALREKPMVRPAILEMVNLSDTGTLNRYCSTINNWFDPQMLSTIVGRDLLLLAGSEQAFGLYNGVFGRYRAPMYVWRDREGEPLWWPDLVHPIASIDARARAAHLAGLLWNCFRGTEASRRYKRQISSIVRGTVSGHPDGPPVSRIIDRWPSDDRERWRKAFFSAL